jgi:hypothetical protein
MLLTLLARAASDETCASGAHNSSLEPAVLPVLDLAPFAAISTTPTSAQRAVAAALDAAARDHGFVALKTSPTASSSTARGTRRPRSSRWTTPPRRGSSG